MKGGRAWEKDKNAAQNIMLQLLNGIPVVVYNGKNARYLNDFIILGLLPEECLKKLYFALPEPFKTDDLCIEGLSTWIF